MSILINNSWEKQININIFELPQATWSYYNEKVEQNLVENGRIKDTPICVYENERCTICVKTYVMPTVRLMSAN